MNYLVIFLLLPYYKNAEGTIIFIIQQRNGLKLERVVSENAIVYVIIVTKYNIFKMADRVVF